MWRERTQRKGEDGQALEANYLGTQYSVMYIPSRRWEMWAPKESLSIENRTDVSSGFSQFICGGGETSGGPFSIAKGIIISFASDHQSSPIFSSVTENTAQLPN